MPFGQLPVLEVDGKQLCQSQAIARYLAREFATSFRLCWQNRLGSGTSGRHWPIQVNDFFLEIRPYFRVLTGQEKGDVETVGKDMLVPAFHKFYAFMSKILNNNKTGYLVGDSLTWVDLLLAETATIAQKFPQVYDGFPEVLFHFLGDVAHMIAMYFLNVVVN
ncbi:hypothetical protein COOONC_16005 [Cooperia oncophora]